LKEELVNTNIDLFLVCNTDLPWKPDPVRENGGDKRLVLHNKYIKEIKKYGFKYQTVSGTGSQRYSNALKHLKESGLT
jgi:nicotinamide riboside kinase